MNKAASREQFIPETRVAFGDDSGCRLKKIPCVLLSVIFVGLLAGVIALAVLFSRQGECSVMEQTTLSTVPITTTIKTVSTPSPIISNPDYRLNKDIIPLKYDLKVQPFLNGKLSYFTGDVKITILCQTPTDRIELHSRYLNTSDIKFSKVLVNDCLSDAMSVNEFKTELTDKLTLELDQKLVSNTTYQICISFNGSMVEKSYKGFYVSEYKDENGNTHYLGATQFQTTSARQVFPCFDEPGFRAKFKIQIIREKKYHSLSNMERETIEDLNDGWFLDTFKESVEMSTYLVAFIVSEFDVYPKDISLKASSFSVWSNPALISQAIWAHDIGEKIQKRLGELLDSPYSLPKTDMVALPDFAAGAMENWGLITYREIAMLYDVDRSAIFYKDYVASVVAHELNHMWFGNLVGPEWWSESWLNEGFASYFVFRVIQDVHPAWPNYESFIRIEDCDNAFRADARNSSTPLKYNVSSSREVSNIFGTIIYSKGSCFLNMLSKTFGDNLFINAIKEYIKENANTAVNQNKLFSYFIKYFSNETEVEVEKFLNSWSLQAGYPVVNIYNLTYINNTNFTFHVSQNRFLIDPRQTAAETIWNIPLTFHNDMNAGKVYWLNEKEEQIEISLKSNWTIGNVDQVGFYRVNYDDKGWEAIIKNYEGLSELTRAQIISDSFNLARADQLQYKYPLKLIKTLEKETDYAPWKIAATEIQKLLVSLQDSIEFTKSIKDIIDSAYKEEYWKIWPSDAELDKQLLYNIIVDFSCSIENKDCIKKAREVFENWISEKPTGVAPIQLATAVCTSLKHGTSQDWESAVGQYLKSNIISEQFDLLIALSCTREPWILKRYMLLAMNPNQVRPINAYLVFRNIALNKDASYLFMDFLQERWEELEKGFSDMFTNAVVGSLTRLANGLSSNYDKEKMETFKSNVNSTYHPYFDSAIETIDENTRWLETHKKEIEMLLPL